MSGFFDILSKIEWSKKQVLKNITNKCNIDWLRSGIAKNAINYYFLLV